MPLHRIYAAPGTFFVDDKSGIAERITAFYTGPNVNLPAFYVSVLFIDVPEDSFYIGGKPRKDFVRIVSQQLARFAFPIQISEPSVLSPLIAASPGSIAPVTLMPSKHAGHPFSRSGVFSGNYTLNSMTVWRIQGMEPPLPITEEEKKWVQDQLFTNRAHVTHRVYI